MKYTPEQLNRIRSEPMKKSTAQVVKKAAAKAAAAIAKNERAALVAERRTLLQNRKKVQSDFTREIRHHQREAALATRNANKLAAQLPRELQKINRRIDIISARLAV